MKLFNNIIKTISVAAISAIVISASTNPVLATTEAAEIIEQEALSDEIGTINTGEVTKDDKATKKKKETKTNPEDIKVAHSGEDVVEYAMQFVGNRYRYGGTSLTNGVDCSGFVMKVYEKFGVSLPHSSGGMRSKGKAVSRKDVKPGDIICYPGHVAIAIGDDAIVHASTYKTGIKISYDIDYKNVVTIRRIFE